MKNIASLILFIVLSNWAIGQNQFIQIETNKTLCLVSFLEASIGQQGTSSSYTKYIDENLGSDKEFVRLLNMYGKLNLDYSGRRQEYPDTRYSVIDSKDLIWIAASNSSGLADFSERIIGYLPHNTHTAYINILEQIEPYYDSLVWNKEKENIKRMELQLQPYSAQIEELFLTISKFYNTQWDVTIPFKICLYPIPLERGNTTAIPKGNALICGFLSHNEKSSEGLVGVIVHEMCHILYGQQGPEVQTEQEEWFLTSKSPYKKLAYTYIDEGLATVFGNGWAYEQMNGKVDESEWYNDEYIDGFAHAMFNLAKEYVSQNKSIDQNYVDKSIELFAKTFPKATHETSILMNEVQLFANTEVEEEIDLIFEGVHGNFNIRSMWLSTPIDISQSWEKSRKEQTTKLFIVDSKNEETIKQLNNNYPEVTIKTNLNSIDVLFDKESDSVIIIININGFSKLSKALAQLSGMKYLEFGKNYKIEE